MLLNCPLFAAFNSVSHPSVLLIRLSLTRYIPTAFKSLTRRSWYRDEFILQQWFLFYQCFRIDALHKPLRLGVEALHIAC